MHSALWLVLLAGMAPPAEGAREILVVTSSAPLDGERLADALRAYLGDFGIEVRTALEAPSSDLREDLAGRELDGDAGRALALAIVRVDGTEGTVEIRVIDRVTDKTLLASIPRPPQSEDLYRAVALKVEALLRSTLAEAPELLRTRPALARLAGVDGLARTPEAAPAPLPRLALAAGYTVSSFPLGALTQEGLSFSVSTTLGASTILRAHRELGVTVAALAASKTSSGDVTIVAKNEPVDATLSLRWSGARADLLAGITGELAFTNVTASGPPMTASPGGSILPGLGGTVEGRFALGAKAWLFARGQALGMLTGDRYLVRGEPAVDTSRFQARAALGLGVTAW